MPQPYDRRVVFPHMLNLGNPSMTPEQIEEFEDWLSEEEIPGPRGPDALESAPGAGAPPVP